jgi:ATP-binding cassette, subfamily C, bacterial
MTSWHISARRFLRTLWGGLPGRSWLLVLLMMLGVLTEGLGILLLVPLLELVGLESGGGALGRIAEAVEGAFGLVNVEPTLAALLVVFVVLVSARALIQLKEATAGARLEQEFVLRLRTRLYRAATYSDWQVFSRGRGSDVIHAMVDELHRVSVATTHVLRLVTQFLVGTVYLVIAASVSLPITAVAVACGTALLLALRGWNTRARRTGARVSQEANAMFAAVHEHVAAMKTARSYGAEDRSVRIFADLAGSVAQAYVAVVREQAVFSALFGVGAVLILSVIVYASFALLAVPAAGILLLLFLFARLVPRFSSMQTSYHMFMSVVPAFDRVMDLIEQYEAAAEPSDLPKEVAEPRLTLTTRVELRGVRFGYAGASHVPALNGLDLVLPARRTTALVGASGAGKSTVADMVLGLLRPDAGTILIDDTPLGPDTLREWRRQVGYVPQDPFLFHDTIRANLLWARPDATEEECWEALRMAAAAAFVARLPGGMDAVVGDRGTLISGGERQRLVLARALLRDPALLVLDEATSALDAASEAEVQEAIRGLRGRTTIFVISHRLSTIRDADTIHVMDAGRVVESGTWEELAGRPSGPFRELCRLQGLVDPIAARPADPFREGD